MCKQLGEKRTVLSSVSYSEIEKKGMRDREKGGEIQRKRKREGEREKKRK